MKTGPGAPPAAVLILLIGAQLLGISLWFASSAVLPSLTADWGLAPADGGLLISAVQIGFIAGTLLFALTNLADIFRPSRVFLVATFAGAAANLLFAHTASGLGEALAYRFLTGVAMAGVYPVGMKIVVSFYPTGLGHALGWLIGAFSVGSAAPFLLRFLGAEMPWQTVISAASGLAVLSGLIVVALGDGPHLPPAARLEVGMMFRVFRIPAYRASAFAYFGHCWEIYALWVLSPLLVAAALRAEGWDAAKWSSLGAFAVIAGGGVGCVVGGMLTRRHGSRPVAAVALAASGAFCLGFPLLAQLPAVAFLPLLVLWSIFAVADSPQFSALSSAACPPQYVGTGLTIQNSIGFIITVAGIEATYRAYPLLGPYVGWLMAPGPLLGLYFLLSGPREGAEEGQTQA